MSLVRRSDHIGITVADLDAVTAFFIGLGLEVEGRDVRGGEYIDTVIGIPDSRTEIVMLRPPDDGSRLELSRFAWPDHEPGSPAAMANEQPDVRRQAAPVPPWSSARLGLWLLPLCRERFRWVSRGW
jgi:catechol 2,3-dioxygenase-like lactoylglutathione lyase family enzyme